MVYGTAQEKEGFLELVVGTGLTQCGRIRMLAQGAHYALKQHLF